MKFKISTSILKNITNILTKVISKDIPGSSGGVFVSVNENFVIFKTQQFDFNLMYSVKVENPSLGNVFLPINIFDAIISTLSDSFVNVELKNNKIYIETGASNSEIFILDEGENNFEIDIPKTTPEILIEREIFIKGLKNVQHAASSSFIRPEIASIFVYTQGKTVYFVATDKYRLAESRFTSDSISDNVSILISIKNIQKIIRVLEHITDSVIGIHSEDDFIFIVTDLVVIKTRLVRENFIDYKNIIPKSVDSEIIILKSDIINFLKKTRLFSNKIMFSLSNKENLILCFENDEVGSTKNTIPVVVKGDVGDIPSFECKFIGDALASISDEKIVLTLKKTEERTVMMIRGLNDKSFTSIISPLVS